MGTFGYKPLILTKAPGGRALKTSCDQLFPLPAAPGTLEPAVISGRVSRFLLVNPPSPELGIPDSRAEFGAYTSGARMGLPRFASRTGRFVGVWYSLSGSMPRRS